MDERRQRALLLFQQERHELAERELRVILAEDPAESWALATLGLSLMALGKLDAAEASVRSAIEAAPESDYPHKANAILLVNRGRLKEGRAAVLEAARLDPDDAGHRAYLAAIELDLGKPQDALRAADEALALDPRKTTALNVRAKALIALGQPGEARQVLDRSLEIDPERGDTHEAMGAALLHTGDTEGALSRYREALRLDPNSEAAREGFLQALKARHRLYRWVLKFFLWIDRQKVGVRVGVIAAIIGGKHLLRLVARESPELAPVATALAVPLLLFLLLTWFADPLFNLLVRFDPVGRHALTPRQRAVSNFLLVFILIVAGIATGLAVAPDSFVPAAVGAGSLILLPLTVLLSFPRGSRQRRRLAALTCAVAALGAAAGVTLAAGGGSASANVAGGSLALAYALGCLLSVCVRGRGGEGEEDDMRGVL